MLHLVVFSGLCNRLFAIISAMRYARQTQQPLTIYWKIPVSRYGLPYQANQLPDQEHLNFFFQGVPDITLKTWVPNLIAQIFNEYPGTVMLYDGSKIIPEFMPKTDHGQVIFPSNFLDLVNQPLSFERKKNVIINLPTKPFGFIEDNMKLYLEYPMEPGVIKHKTLYERELSKFARKLRPIRSIQNIIDYYLSRFSAERPRVGIHLRRTDLHTKVTQKRLDDVMDKYIKKYQITHQIYFCSDSAELQHRYVSKYNLTTYADDRKTQNNLEGAQKALVDLHLLASCNHILGTSRSSFSYYSFILADDQSTYEIHS